MNNFTFYAKWYKENFKFEDVPEALVGYLPVFKSERVKTVCVGHVDEILRETLSYYTNAPEALFRKASRKVYKRDLIARKALRNGFDNLSVTEWYYIEGILRPFPSLCGLCVSFRNHKCNKEDAERMG